MKITHREAMLSESYKENCYKPLDTMANLGGWTLVSEGFFCFEETLIEVAGRAVTEHTIE
jgi:hypothetical protein